MTAIEPAGTLAQLEGIIERGLETFIEVGQALMRIRDERLYREAGYSSFEVYCQERWGHRRAWADRQISAMRKVAELDPTGSTPANEWQARQLPGPDQAEDLDAMAARLAGEYPDWTEDYCRLFARNVLEARRLIAEQRQSYRRGLAIRAELQAALNLGEIPPEEVAGAWEALQELGELLAWMQEDLILTRAGAAS